MQAIETMSVRLEPLCAVHAETMYRGLADYRLYAFISEEPPVSSDALRTRYARLEARWSPSGHEQWLNWVVLRKPALDAAGYVQATVSDETAAIAYVIFADFWGCGLGRESVQAMLMHLHNEYSVQRATATVDPRNRRSIRLLDALGFHLENITINASYINGVKADDAEYALNLVASSIARPSVGVRRPGSPT